MTENERTNLLIGSDSVEILKNSTVLIVGVGGVGGMAAESLARSGIGTLILIDADVVEPSNINRQLAATSQTIGQVKVDVLKKRIETIDPQSKVIVYHRFYDKDMDEELDSLHPDFVLDCIDSISSKQDLISWCLKNDVPFIASMGMARRKDPACIRIMELEKTSYDPLAKRMRVWKRKNRIRKKIMTVCSTEKPIDVQSGQPLPSMMFVPASAGLTMAAECVRQFIERKEKNVL